jgi:hypothetical protein
MPALLTTVENQLMMISAKTDILIGPADVPQAHTTIVDEVAVVVVGEAEVAVNMTDIVEV